MPKTIQNTQFIPVAKAKTPHIPAQNSIQRHPRITQTAITNIRGIIQIAILQLKRSIPYAIANIQANVSTAA